MLETRRDLCYNKNDKCREAILLAKLYFKYGTMGSSKTAQALITKFNYEERGMAVWLIKPATDDRDGVDIVASRIGLSARAQVIYPDSDPLFKLARRGRTDVIICDECQFLTPAQVDSLREIVDEKGIPVLCFGLRADFRTMTFPGSKRLFELAVYVTAITAICARAVQAALPMWMI